MTDYLSPDIAAALKAAHKAGKRQSKRLRVQIGERQYPVLKLWDKGFELESAPDSKLRGFVDIFDGTIHLMHGLVVAHQDQGEAVQYEFKRVSPAQDKPPLDYAREAEAPVALIGKSAPPLH